MKQFPRCVKRSSAIVPMDRLDDGEMRRYDFGVRYRATLGSHTVVPMNTEDVELLVASSSNPGASNVLGFILYMFALFQRQI